ncbi:MAG: glycosyltransferase family 2 protein [Acidimicrobiales bacterium]
MKRTVGVIVPVYNGADFVHQALASLVAQSRQVDQVVVIDDGSVDESLTKIKEWTDRLPLTVLEQGANGGVSAARNAGLDALDTDLVALLDADDVWFPDHVELCVQAQDRFGGIISPGAFIWHPGGSLRPYNKQLRLEVPAPHKQLASLLHRNFVFVSAMVELAEVKAQGGFRPHTVEDWDLWLRLVAKGLVVTQLDRPTVLYRRHPGNFSRMRSTIVRQEIELLERFRTELPDRYQPVIRRSVRHRQSELQVAEHLEAGDYTRRQIPASMMIGAFRGGWRSKLKASVVVAAPRLASRLHNDRR